MFHFSVDPVTYAIQVIAIPQYSSVPVDLHYDDTIHFDGDKGGVVAVACNGEWTGQGLYADNNSNKYSTVAKQSGSNLNAEPYSRGGLRYIGNTQMRNRLPIGAGEPSIFVLTKSLDYTAGQNDYKHGAQFGGCHYSFRSFTGGVGNDFVNDKIEFSGGYKAKLSVETNLDVAASGAKGSQAFYDNILWPGGYGSNGTDNPGKINVIAGKQGAHVFIVADTYKWVSHLNILTGGTTGFYFRKNFGGAGYGGGTHLRCMSYAASQCIVSSGGYNGGGSINITHKENVGGVYGIGGSSGWCFVYCNHAIEQKTEGTVLFD